MKRCSACATENEDGAAFCAGCGKDDFAPVVATEAAPAVDLASAPAPEPAGDPGTHPRRRWLWPAIAAAIIAILAVTATVLLLLPGQPKDPGFDTYLPQVAPRLAGPSPIATAIELSKLGWTEAGTAVLVAENDPAAAAVAGPLATKYGGPVLLTAADAVPQQVLDELTRLKVSSVVLLGAYGRLDPAIEQAVSAIAQVKLISGVDDYAMADAVASDVAGGKRVAEIIVVRHSSVATIGPIVGGYSARFGVPVLFSDDSGALQTDKALLKILKPTRALIAGETTASVTTDLGSASRVGFSASEPAGLAAEFGEYAYTQGMEYATVFVVRRADIAYAYSLAPLAGKDEFRSPLLITDDDAIGESASAFLNDHASSIKTIRFLGPGGTSAAAVEKAATDAAATIISKRALVVGDTASPVKSFDTTSGAMQLDAAAVEGKALAIGSVIVAPPAKDSPGGLLRRVTSVERRGDAFVLGTEQASLTQVVSKGSLDMRSVASQDSSDTADAVSQSPPEARVVPALYRAPSARGEVRDVSLPIAPFIPPRDYNVERLPDPVEVPTSELTLGSAGGVTATYRPRASVGAGIVIHATFVPRPGGSSGDYISRAKDFEVRVLSSISIGAELKATIKSDEVIKDLGTVRKDLPQVNLYTITGAIGYVPVWADIVLQPYVRAGVTYESELSLQGTVTVDSQLGFEVVYDENEEAALRPIAGMKVTPSWTFAHKGTLKADVAIGMNLAVNLYSVLGPYVGAECFIQAKGTSTFLEIGSDAPPPSGGDGETELGFGLRPTIGGRFKVIEGLADFDLGQWAPKDEQLAEMGLYRVLWSSKPNSSGGALTYFDEAENMVTILADGSVERIPPRNGQSWSLGAIGVPSPDGRFVAWIGHRPHNGDFMGLDFVELPTGRLTNATGNEEQTEWRGWSKDSRRAYFQSYDSEPYDFAFDSASHHISPGSPTDLAAERVAGWDGTIGDNVLRDRLANGAAATKLLKATSANSGVHVLTVQTEPTTGRLAFSTWFSYGEDGDGQFIAPPRYDIWTADPDGSNVKWVAKGYGPVWNAVTK